MKGEENMIFRIKQELITGAEPDWPGLKEQIASQLADELLRKLQDPPSTEGRLLQIICDRMTEPVVDRARKKRKGA